MASLSHVCSASSNVLIAVLAAFNLMSDSSSAQTRYIVTKDSAEVATFQAGTHVVGFDSIPPNDGGNLSGNTGRPIRLESQVTTQFQNLGVIFSSTGGPIAAISVQGLANESDAHSPFNIVGGSLPSDSLPTISYVEPINLRFIVCNTITPGYTSRVGAWNDPSGSRIRLKVFDANGVLLDSIEADEGFFVGIIKPNISSACFSFVSRQRTNGFSLDDVTFGPVQAVPTRVDYLLSPTLPTTIELNQNYPNPFNPSTTICFSLSKTQTVSLKVYDLFSREVTTLINNERKTAGNYKIVYDANRLASGVYIYRLQTGNFTATKKMLLMR